MAAIRADAYLFLFNRETGEPLLPIEDRPVPQDEHQRTVPTQPFPLRTEGILPECSYRRDRVPPPFQPNRSSYTPPSVDEQTVVAPGVPIPLVRVTPMAFSPQTGYIYAQGRARRVTTRVGVAPVSRRRLIHRQRRDLPCRSTF